MLCCFVLRCFAPNYFGLDVAVLLGVFLCLSHVAVHVDCGIPQRPEAFTSEDELRDYLGNLNNYLSVAGRPR